MASTIPILLVGCSLLAMTSCGQNTVEPSDTERSQLMNLQSLHLLASEPNSIPSDYYVQDMQIRLLGVQSGDSIDQGFATIADTSTWKTRNLKVGELIGHNYRLTAIQAHEVQLQGPQGNFPLTVGQDIRVQPVLHRLDGAALYQGKLLWLIDAQRMAEVQATYGIGARTEPFAISTPSLHQNALRLTKVEPKGVLGRLDLNAGDILVSFENQPLSSADLPRLAASLSTPQNKPLKLRVIHPQAWHELTLRVQ